VKVEGGPAVVGVPEITPVLAFRVNPAGKLPCHSGSIPRRGASAIVASSGGLHHAPGVRRLSAAGRQSGAVGHTHRAGRQRRAAGTAGNAIDDNRAFDGNGDITAGAEGVGVCHLGGERVGPKVVGVPLIAPSEAVRVNPGGKLPN